MKLSASDKRFFKRIFSFKKVWLLSNCLLALGLVLSQQGGFTPSSGSSSDQEWTPPSYMKFLLPLLPSHHLVALRDASSAEAYTIGTVQSYTFRRGDSFFDALLGMGIPAQQIDAILRAGKTVYDLAQVAPGRQVRFMVDQTSGLVQWLEYEIGGLKRLKIEREGDRFLATSEPIPVQTEVRFAEGVVVDNLYNAARKARVPHEVILDFADLFAWDIDFSQETVPGDRFRVVYEVLLREGKLFDTGKILAAEYFHQGERFQTFYYAPKGKADGYFDSKGTSVKKAFLKSPLRYRYISSGFSYDRYHPILHVRRPHLGVDYAAPRGTPVMAAADGRVRFKGWKGGFGNCIILRHPNGYSTLYGHLQGFAAGLHAGQRVDQKEIIGYVGSTGISTGPHLHYTFMRHGVPINPVQAVHVTAENLTGSQMEQFGRQIAPYQRWMETPTPDMV
jgi:murein DD-endopeptidase MepM/ murein hydrolase activator NlpD